MDDYTASYERLLSGGGGGTVAYQSPSRAPPPGPPSNSPNNNNNNGFLDPRTPVSTSAESPYTARYMAGGTGSLPFLGGLYGSSGSAGVAGGNPMGPSPYRTGAAGSGLVNTRTFWPPTPPPEAYSRCSVGGSYYPMFSSMTPMVPPSDLTFSCASLLPRLSSNPFTHLLGNHKDSPFLPLRLNSPVTPSHPLTVPHMPYLHLPTPSLDQCYPSTPGLYSPLTLHSVQNTLQDPRPTETEVKPSVKAIKAESEPANVTEVNETSKRSKVSPKVASVKAREKRDEPKKLPALSSTQQRKVSAAVPVMTATVSPCNMTRSTAVVADASSVKCSKCSASVDESCSNESVKVNVAHNVVVPVSQATACSTTSTAVASMNSVTVTQTSSSESQNNNKVNTTELKPATAPQTTTESVLIPQTPKPSSPLETSPKKVQSPPTAASPPLAIKRSISEDQKQSVRARSYANSPLETGMPSITRAVETTSVCTFSSWVHHQTSVTSVIKQDLPESDSCVHAVQSQMTVVNLSMDKGDSPKATQRARSESTLIFQMQNTHNAQQVKCHKTTEEVITVPKRASKCSVKELPVTSPVCVKENAVKVGDTPVHVESVKGLAVDKTVCVIENSVPSQDVERIKELPSVTDKSLQGVVVKSRSSEEGALQQQAINLSIDRSKISEKDCSTASAQQNSIPCDIKKASGESAHSLDALSKLAKSPAGLPSGGPSSPWNATTKAKPSSVVSSIQSENLQTKSGSKKSSDHSSAPQPVASSPVCQPVMSNVKVNEEVKVAKVANTVQSHDLLNHATCSNTSHPIAISNPITSSSVSSSIPVGIAVAQLRHDSSTVSIKKAVVKANNVTNKTLPYSVPAMIDKGDKRFIRTTIAPATDTTMIVNPTPTLSQWDPSSAVVRPATLSGSWLTPAQPVVTPTVWLGASYQTPATQATLGQPLGSLVETAPTTNALVPPVGYHLARDPMTGHLYLIPTPNIDIVDQRSNVWSTYTPNPVQQVISHFPTTINGTKKELKPILTSPQMMEKSELPIIQPRLMHMTDQTMTQDIKDIKSLNTAIQSSVTSITVQTGQPFTFPGFTSAPQPTLSYFYDQPTIVHIAQSQAGAPTMPTVTQVQSEPGKRSQGTSPLNSMTPSPLPQPCTQTSECESDIESLVGSETSNKATMGVTASCQVDMDACSINSNDMDYEERAVEVFDSANQTDNVLLEPFKEEPEECSTASFIVKDDNEDVEEETKETEPEDDDVVKQDEEEEEPLLNNTNFEEEEVAAPVLPTESKPVIDFIDQHGLNLLVDSIEEFASRENQKEMTKETISINFNDEPRPSASKTYDVDTTCTDGLGLLCALAEQRFLEETKNCDDDDAMSEVCRARSCSPDMPYRQGEMPASRTKGAGNVGRSGSLSSSRCQSPVLLNPAELEMRFKLAELQRRYKMKQKELAKLKPRKDRDSSSSEGSSFHPRFPTGRESLDETLRKKNRKGYVQCVSRDSSPNKPRAFSDTTNTAVPSDSVHPPVVESRPEVYLATHAPTFNPFVRHVEKPRHQVFPNLVKFTAMKPADECDESAFDFPTETDLKVKPKKKDDKKNNKSLFQLWKEKKLAEELSKGLTSSKKEGISQNKGKIFLKTTEGSPKKKTKISKSPIGKESVGEMVESLPVKEDSLKRPFVAVEATPRVESDPNAKRLKMESVNNMDQLESTHKTSEEVVSTEQPVDNEATEDKPDSGSEQAPKAKKREKRSSSSIDDIWSRRRSERIFLHDAGVILPSSLAYTGKNSPTSNNNNNKSSGGTDSGKNSLRLQDQSKKKSSKKENGTKKFRTKDHERQNHVPLEMFLALRQCRLSELGLAASMALTSGGGGPSATSSQEDSSGSEGDVPLSMLLQMEKKNLFIPELPLCQMQVSDLRDCQRVLMEEDDLYYAGYVTAIQAPDVYGITLDRERGNRPHIFSREEMLEQTVKEVKPVHVKQIPEGTRVCAYWSQQYRCLYPGTVTKGNSEEAAPQDKNTVFVEFDDGDSGRIPLEDVRLLVPDPTAMEDQENKDAVQETTTNAASSVPTPAVETKPTTTLIKSGATLDDQSAEDKVTNIEPEITLSSDTLKAKSEKKLKVKNLKAKAKSGLQSKTNLSSKLRKPKFKSNKITKSSLVKKIKNRLEKSKKKSAKKSPQKSVTVEGLRSEGGESEMNVGVESIVKEQATDENGNSIKTKKVKGLSKLEGKRISKLKNSFVLKKGKHHFSETSRACVLQKIKNTLKKSRKNKKDKASSEDMSVESCESSECKVKKRKKHKTDHKHHHHHHKKHCHHHHKKRKRKNEEIPETSALTISVGTEDETKVDMPMCCVSPGRSELSVKIFSNGIKTVETPVDVKTPKAETQDERAEENVFLFPVKSNNKNSEKSPIPKSDNESKKEASSEPKSPKKRKERKISCEKSKIAAFLPARQLWRWSGKSFKRPGTKGKGKKEYFKAITRGKETIRVGDCAVFLSTGRPHLPYVGRIETMWQTWGGNTVVKVKWFYHPEETKGGKKLVHPKGALFQSPHVDENDVQTISHKCEVLSWTEYQKWCEGRVGGTRGTYENEDVYYLAGNYEPLAKILTLEPGVS